MAFMVIGVFPSRDQAENAAQALLNSGFHRDSLGAALRLTPAAAHAGGLAPPASIITTLPHHRIVNLTGIGDTLLAGTLEECLPKAGSATPLADALTCLGIQRTHAEWFADQARQGYDLVTVRTELADQAQQILDRFGSLHVPAWQRTPGTFTTRPAQLSDEVSQTQGIPTPGSGPAPPDAAALARIQPGLEVVTQDGYQLGTVQASEANCIHVIACWNLFVPPERIQAIEPGRIVLNVPSTQIDQIDWAACQPTSSHWQPGGPGISGLPPQQHEAGVNLPIEPAD